MRVKIEVTEKDIRYGRQEDSHNCAIARAAKRLFKRGKEIEVSGDEIRVYHERLASLPLKAQNFIESFDENKKSVKPFSFTVNVSKEFLK